MVECESYRKLIAYQKGYELVKKIYRLTDSYPGKESYGLISQLRRASVSIPTNIAEGYVRGSKEYLQFLKIALGSSPEVETLLSLSKDLNFCSLSSFQEAYDLNLEVTKLIRAYIKGLRAGE